MHYDGFDPITKRGYLYQPRPGSGQAITVSRLSAREKLGAWAQVKKNGTASTLYVGPDRMVRAMNRHYAAHKLWQPGVDTHRAFAELPGTGWYVFAAELLHSKVADPKLKDIHYIHDIMVADSHYLVGTTFADRQHLLQSLFPDTVPAIGGGLGYRVIDPHTWLAVNYLPGETTAGFEGLWRTLTRPEDEGLVLKMPEAKLAICFKETANDAWQYKCRRPTKNFSH